MKHKNTLKLFAAILAIVGIGTALFNGATNAVVAAEMKSVQTVPTSYQVPASTVAEIPEGYQKANYHVSMNDLNTGTPTVADLTMEEAADAGVRYLVEIYGTDFEGANVFMMYNPGTGTFPRAFWSGSVLFSDVKTPETTSWSFFVDSVTGELLNAGYYEKLDVKVPLEEDASLKKNYSVYADLARNYAAKCHLINGEISEITYEGQGYVGNNPEITVRVIGENGEYGLMTFSRYDQTLLGISTGNSNKISDSARDAVLDESEADEATVHF